MPASTTSTTSSTSTSTATSSTPHCGQAVYERLETKPNPERAAQRLGDRDQRCLEKYLAPGETASDSRLSLDTHTIAGQQRCWTWTSTLTQYNNWDRRVLWTYSQQKNWCSDNGSTLNYEVRKRTISVQAWFWTGEHIDSEEDGGEGKSYTRHYTQGEFSYCIAKGVGCLLSIYPWIDTTGYANGTYRSSWGK